LYLWEEMRWVYRHYPEVAPEQIVRMGTVHGARALGVEAEAGTLAPGKRAGLAVIPWPTEARGDPYELLLAADSPTLSAGTWVAYHA
jgi:imidazolonepropionase-like amidohydrolase